METLESRTEAGGQVVVELKAARVTSTVWGRYAGGIVVTRWFAWGHGHSRRMPTEVYLYIYLPNVHKSVYISRMYIVPSVYLPNIFTSVHIYRMRMVPSVYLPNVNRYVYIPNVYRYVYIPNICRSVYIYRMYIVPSVCIELPGIY